VSTKSGEDHAQWRPLGPTEKIERLFNMSLDDLYEIMSWPIGELDPYRLSVRMQVTRVVFMVGVKAMLDGQPRSCPRARPGAHAWRAYRRFEQNHAHLQERGE
jgi:hypothetical protein